MTVIEAAGVRAGEDARTDSLERFVADVEALRQRYPETAALANAVAARLEALLRDGRWLRPEARAGWPDRYRQHVLHVAPDGGFSVVALVWRPGQATPVHDHVAWCVVGVLQGEERETRYHLYEQAGERFLVECADGVARPGETAALVPPDEDIHRVANVGEGVAISIHVYGADIGRLGSSINRRFDDLPIQAEAGSARRVSWRTRHAS